MRVILISTDRKVLEQGSVVSQRIAEYRDLFDELHVIVLNGKFSGIFQAYKAATKLLATSGLRSETVISTQDPFETGLIGVLLKLFYGVPLQIQLHTDFNNKYFLLSSPLNFMRFFLGHLTLPFADGVRTVSERSKKGIVDLAKNISVLPIYTEAQSANRKAQVDQSKIIILTAGRLEKEKNLETAIKAFEIISKKYPNAEFQIAGEGSERKKLEKLTKELGIGDRVKLLGWQNNRDELYANADIYISTSLFEGYGMSVVEAAQAGLALVLTDAGIANEYFKNEESAFILSPKNVGGFAEALEKLIHDRTLIKQMGESAKEAVLKHAISQQEYLSKFQSVMKSSLENNFTSKSSGLERLAQYINLIFNRNRVLRFILAGVTAATTQLLTLYFFTSIVGLWYIYSSLIAFVVATSLSFALQKLWAFRDRELRGAHIQFMKYFIVALIGISLNTLFLYVLVDKLHIWYIFSQIMAGALIAVFNFLCYRKFIFKS